MRQNRRIPADKIIRSVPHAAAQPLTWGAEGPPTFWHQGNAGDPFAGRGQVGAVGSANNSVSVLFSLKTELTPIIPRGKHHASHEIVSRRSLLLKEKSPVWSTDRSGGTVPFTFQLRAGHALVRHCQDQSLAVRGFGLPCFCDRSATCSKIASMGIPSFHSAGRSLAGSPL